MSHAPATINDMPTRFSLTDSLLELTLEGAFTNAEVLTTFRQGLASAPSGKKLDVLIDVTKSGELKEFEDLQLLGRFFVENADSLGGRIAVLVSDTARFGVARQLGGLLDDEGLEVAPFRDRDAALDWVTLQKEIQ